MADEPKTPPLAVEVIGKNGGKWLRTQLTLQNFIMVAVFVVTAGNWVNTLWVNQKATAERQEVAEALYLADRQRAQEVYTQQQVMFERVTVTLDSIKERLARIEASLPMPVR